MRFEVRVLARQARVLRSVTVRVDLSREMDALGGREGMCCTGLTMTASSPYCAGPGGGGGGLFCRECLELGEGGRRMGRGGGGGGEEYSYTQLPLIHTHTTRMHSLVPGDKEEPGSGTSRSAEEQVGSVVASFLPLQPAAAPSLVLWQEAEGNDDDQNKRGTVNGDGRSSSYNNAPLLSVGVASMYVRNSFIYLF